jgi:8-oxo-dGTP pyrophosphatase MutT (NUDIX family)
MSKLVYKTSYGVAMCRYNIDKNNQTEILMIKKRYTYHYFSFIFGHYQKYNNKHLQYLFNNMTFGEKVDILSMKFSNMWYRLWLSDPEKNYNIYNMYKGKQNNTAHMKNLNCYFRKKSKFETIFLRDNGKRLRRLIHNSSNSVTPWEIPKGSSDIDELDMNCAIREFEEETGIYPDKYSILWDVNPITSSHKDENIIYRSVYYLAYFNKPCKWHPKVKFETSHQLSEVEQVQWVALDEIKFLNLNEKTKKRLIILYKKVIHNFKKCVKSKYYKSA